MRARWLPAASAAHHGDLFGLALILQHHEFVTGVSNAVESWTSTGRPGVTSSTLWPRVVEHGPHPAVLGAADKIVSHLQGALQHQDRAHRTPALIQAGLNDMAGGRRLG